MTEFQKKHHAITCRRKKEVPFHSGLEIFKNSIYDNMVCGR